MVWVILEIRFFKILHFFKLTEVKSVRQYFLTFPHFPPIFWLFMRKKENTNILHFSLKQILHFTFICIFERLIMALFYWSFKNTWLDTSFVWTWTLTFPFDWKRYHSALVSRRSKNNMNVVLFCVTCTNI